MVVRTRPAALLLVLIAALAAAACGGRVLGKQYEYEEDLYLALDGSAEMVVNASIPALVALRGLDLDATAMRVDRDKVRAAYTSPLIEVKRVSRPWRRDGRRFIQIRIRVPDIRALSRTPPFSWSRYELTAANGQHTFRQQVGASALRPGTLPNVGWDGNEIVAFRLHLPSRISYHNSRDLDTNETLSPERGNILGWEQHLADRLDGQPLSIEVRMDSQSILHRTLWLFFGAFGAAMLLIAGLIWLTMRKGRKEEAATAP